MELVFWGDLTYVEKLDYSVGGYHDDKLIWYVLKEYFSKRKKKWIPCFKFMKQSSQGPVISLLRSWLKLFGTE